MSDELLAYLFERHFISGSSGEDAVLSSHWKKYGGYSVKKSSSGDFTKAQARAFGDFRKDNLINRLRFYPELMSLKKNYKSVQLEDFYIENARNVAGVQQRLFDFDCIKQVASLTAVNNHVDLASLKSFCVIGDGYGFMSSLLHQLFPDSSVLTVNLGKTLFFDVFYSRVAHPKSNFTLIETVGQRKLPSGLSYLEAENFSLLSTLEIDIFINIASFQEMNLETVRSYLEYIKTSPMERKFLYSCNREEKALPCGEIVRESEYGWDGKDIFKERCSWYDYMPLNRPPWKKCFDGLFVHRLCQF